MQSGNEFRVQNHVRHGRLVGMVVSCLENHLQLV